MKSNTAAKSFIDDQVNQAQEALAAVDKQRLDFMSSHVGNLPTEATSLFTQLGGLREIDQDVRLRRPSATLITTFLSDRFIKSSDTAAGLLKS